MTKKHLTIFATVCQKNSITLAAESLNMTQPAVSIAIKELEQHYNTRLFDRMNRKIYLTESGSILLQYATHITTLFEEAETIFQDDTMHKHLRIGSNVSFGATKLSLLLAQFQKQYPQIQVLSTIDKSYLIEQMVLENLLDLAIVDDIASSDALKKIPFQQEEMICVCSPTYRSAQKQILTVSELASEKLLLREKGSGSRETMEQTLYSLGYTITPIMESSDTQTLLQAALNSLGIMVVQASAVNKLLSAGSLIRLEVTNLTLLRQYYLIYHKSKFIHPPMKQMLDLISMYSSPLK